MSENPWTAVNFFQSPGIDILCCFVVRENNMKYNEISLMCLKTPWDQRTKNGCLLPENGEKIENRAIFRKMLYLKYGWVSKTYLPKIYEPSTDVNTWNVTHKMNGRKCRASYYAVGWNIIKMASKSNRWNDFKCVFRIFPFNFNTVRFTVMRRG